MKCYFHPTKDAIYECSSCGKPICEDCMRFDDEDHVVCPACTLEQAVDYADEDMIKYRDRVQRLREARTEKAGRVDKALEYINGWLVLTILVLVGIHLFLGHYIGRAGTPATFDTKRFADQGDPAPEMSYIVAKLFAYANEHQGQFPEKLIDLFPDYLEHKPSVLGTEEDYVYTPVNGPEGFILNLPRADRFGFRKLYATADGVVKIR